jgi:hypothetical protein
MYRAFRKGEVNAAQNLALTLFYLGDLAGYRRWLRQAARGGDEDAARELSRFEVRQPWPLAQKTKRKRPSGKMAASPPIPAATIIPRATP